MQRQFTKHIAVLQELSYSERLTALNLKSVEYRCLCLDLYLLYKIMFGTCDVDRDDGPTRGHRYKVMLEHCTNSYRKNFFVQRVAPIWNSLPASIVDFSSFASFKQSLNKVNLHIFTHY